MSLKLRTGALVLSCMAVGSVEARADRFSEAQVPRTLRDWIPWAIDGAEERLCPVVGSSATCLWPGRLRLTVDRTGGSFGFDFLADRVLDVPLPGGERRWPQGVRLDGASAVVLKTGDSPAVRVGTGAHRIEGRFTWDRLPDSLPVPVAIALLDLTVDGQTVALPVRDEQGLLILRQGAGAATEAESLVLKVFRRIEDGVPLWAETRVVFEVSGKAREVTLPGALLADSAPVAVGGDLPARLDADRKLRVQVRAGKFGVRVLGRMAGRPQRLALPKTAAPWPGQEVWVFAAAERLRLVQVSGPPPIDPSRTDLPDEWRTLPAFLMEGEAALTLTEARRGEPEAPPDRLDLSRRLWLDESGRGFTVRDSFSGDVGRTTRLNLLAPGELGRVMVAGRAELVTQDPQTAEAGVELRQKTVRVEADSRSPRGFSAPAVGWGASVRSLRAELFLPPGWRLLGATGVDQAPGSWIGSWNLFAFFFVLVVAAASARLLGRGPAALALLTLFLLHGEAEAPRLVWLSLLGAVAVLRVAPEGRLKTLARVWWASSVVVLVLTLVPFAVDQVRMGLFPQVGRVAPMMASGDSFAVAPLARNAAVAPPPAAAPVAVEQEQAQGVEGGVAGAVVGGLADEAEDKVRAPGYPAKQEAGAGRPRAGAERRKSELASQSNVLSYLSRSKAYEQDPHSVVQTGPGVPNWSWTSYALSWSGPVARDHRMRLFLLSPWTNLVLAFLRVGLATWLALRLVAMVLPTVGERLRAAPGVGALFAILIALAAGAPARAQENEKTSPAAGGLIPDPALLEELKTRLTRPPDCAPRCVATASLHLSVEGTELRVAAEVHAGAAAGWPLPGPASSWVPRTVAVDGRPADGQLARFQDGFLRVRLTKGVHQVMASGPLPPRDSVTLQLGETPGHASASAPGWQVDGIREDGSADDSVQLSRRLAREGASANAEGVYEPWLEVRRVLDLGVSWGVETIVRRVSPVGAPVVVKVPLIEGMLVTDAARQVKDGAVLVTLGRDETETRWSATLKPVENEEIMLQAPEGKPWSEVWTVNCGLVWQCEASGLAPVGRFEEGRLAPEFRPWPGESLSLRFRRPRGAPGQTLTIDRVSLHVVPGVRLEDATLELMARASRTGPLTLRLPEGVEVQELKVGGSDRPIRTDGNTLALTIETGERPVRVVWRRSDGIGPLHRVAPVAFDQPAVNVAVSTQLPPGRWVLLTGGPAWGPAVLFWGYLAIILLVAFALGRLPLSPLRPWEWALLGLGIAHLPVFAAGTVAGWFLVMAWRRDRVVGAAALHDLLQLALAFWTVLALVFLYMAVHQGLLLQPDMQVSGGGSTETLLRWYQDRTAGPLPRPWVLSAPLWLYRALMLLWSLWLALRLMTWAPWGWGSWNSGGLWRPLRSKPGGPRLDTTAGRE